MSKGKIEIARRAMNGFNAGDWEVATAEMDAAIEWRPLPTMINGEVVLGRDAVREFWREWRETFEDFRPIIDDLYEAPAGVVAVTRVAGRSVAAGVAITGNPFFQVFEIRDGMILRLRMLATRSEALEAAGLAEA